MKKAGSYRKRGGERRKAWHRAFGALVVALFLAAPVLARHHESHYGTADHHHGDLPCDIWAAAQGCSNLGTASAPALKPPSTYRTRAPAPVAHAAPDNTVRRAAQIRAPPLPVA